jgi:hypothetical protein
VLNLESSQINMTSSTADAVSSYGDSCPTLPTESSLVSACQGHSVKEVTNDVPDKNPGDVLSKPYPSPSVEPDFGSTLTVSNPALIKASHPLSYNREIRSSPVVLHQRYPIVLTMIMT